MQYITNSSEETKSIARKFAQEVSGGIIALVGDLGAGKTTFTQGFAEGLGIKGKIISPTFVLIRQHQIPKLKKTLYHLDLYRLEKLEDIKQLAIDELSTDKNIVLVEWAEKAKELLPADTIWINFKSLNENSREITVTFPDESQ